MWFKVPECVSSEDYKYTYEQNKEWTPYNSNLHMQGIKVIVNNPVPESAKGSGSFGDTMLLLDIVKERKQNELKKEKEEKIRKMALEQKRKQENQRVSMFKASF